jgi:hypothetical protein
MIDFIFTEIFCIQIHAIRLIVILFFMKSRSQNRIIDRICLINCITKFLRDEIIVMDLFTYIIV